MSDSLLIRDCIAVSPWDRTECSILAEDGKITAILPPKDKPQADTTIEAQGRFVIPGGIDTHVHLGIGEQSFAEDCFTESRSAVSGGITSFIHYLVNPGPQGSYLEVYEDYVEGVRSKSLVDVAFHLRVMTEQHLEEIPRCVEEAHITSFKFNRSDLVLPPGAKGYSGAGDDLLLEGLRAVGDHEGCVSVVHCENVEIIQRGMKTAREAGGQDLVDWSDSRPPYAEAESVQSALYWAIMTEAPLLVAHMSVGEGVHLLREKQSEYGFLFGETCPQYLMLDKSMPLGSLGKCAPPIRTPADSEELWQGLIDGTIDCVGSDHCTYTAAYKGAEMWSAHMGLPGMGIIIPILLSAGVNERGLRLERLVAVTSFNAARYFGFYPQKGSIQVGADADLVVLDLEREVTITPETLNSVVDYTPYEGYECRGWPLITIVAGNVVAEAGQVVDETPRGRYLKHLRFSDSNEVTQ
jgi:dihydropyrimidinase